MLFLHLIITFCFYYQYQQQDIQIRSLQFKKMSKQEDPINWVSVLAFLQKQQTQITMRQQEWNLERHQLQEKISRLEAELDSNKIVIGDLINRIKLLEIALLDHKMEKAKKNGSVKPGGNYAQDLQKVESLIEKYRLQSKVKDDHKQFLTQILSQVGIDSKQVMAPASTSILPEQFASIYKKEPDLKISDIGCFNAHLDAVRKIYVNDGKDFMVTVSEDCLVKVWSYASVCKNRSEHLEPAKTYREHAGPLFALAGGPSPFNPQECLLFTGGSDCLIKKWHINNKSVDSATPTSTWACSKQTENNTVIWDLALNGNKLLTSCSDGLVTLYEVNETEGATLKQEFKEKQFNPSCVAWINQETFIQGCSNAPRAHIWDLGGKVKQKFLYEIPKGSQAEQYQINQICLHKSMKIASLACEDGAVRLYSTNFGRMIRKIQLEASVSCIKPRREWQLVCGTHSGGVSIWDLRTYLKVAEFEKSHLSKYDQGVFCLWTQPNQILSGGSDGVVRIFS